MISAETYFRDSDYWQAWQGVPEATADLPYAEAAIEPQHWRILDAPCGRGRLLRRLGGTQKWRGLYGLDINARLVEQARVLPGVTVLKGSVYALPWIDRYFDATLCHESLMHFERPAQALTELARVTKHRLYVSVTTGRNLNAALRRVHLLPTTEVPHWTYNLEDLYGLLPADFSWRIVGGFMLGRKALRLSHRAHARWHKRLGWIWPQWVLRRYGQSLFCYGTRITFPAPGTWAARDLAMVEGAIAETPKARDAAWARMRELNKEFGP